MSWLTLSLVVTRDQAPLIETLLEDLGALSTSCDDAGSDPILEPEPGRTDLWPATRVTGLFPAEADADGLRARIARTLRPEITRRLQIDRLEDRDWERVWLDTFHPIRFGERLWICPSGQTVREPGAVVVNLDPGLAFGTGTHPTTALCLRWLERAELSGRTLLDYGCGSGVLAIAGLLLGAGRAVGVDHDPQALVASRANAVRNGVSERLALYRPEDLPSIHGDVLVANILAAPLVEMATSLTGLLLPGGAIALSGILAGQAGQVGAAYRGAVRMDEPVEQEGWVLLSGVRSRDSLMPSVSMVPASDPP